MEDKKKQERGIVHLFKRSSGEHFYYGNMKALFDAQEKEENDGSLGVAYNYMKNYDFSGGKVYANAMVEIRKGIIETQTNKNWVRNNKKRATKENK